MAERLSFSQFQFGTDDFYRKNVIHQVRARPILWNYFHAEYKNYGLRRQAWDEIDANLPVPDGFSNSKATWEALQKSLNHVLNKRRKMKGECELLTPVTPWKFEKDMDFLMAFKRGFCPLVVSVSGPSIIDNNSSGTYSSNANKTNILKDVLTSCNEVKVHSKHFTAPSVLSQGNDQDYHRNVSDDGEEYSSDSNIKTEAAETEENINLSSTNSTYSLRRRENLKRPKYMILPKPEDDDDEDFEEESVDIKRKQQRLQQQKHLYSTNSSSSDGQSEARLGFFRSLMPAVNKLDHNQFLSFQIEILQKLQTFQ